MVRQIVYSYKEFMAYLLIYAAFTDLEMSDAESSRIIDIVGEEDFDHILKLFKKHSDYQSIRFIQEQAQYYIHSRTDKKSLLDDMREIILADGEINHLEEEVIRIIGKIL